MLNLLDKDRYEAVSPLLDRALELTAGDRTKWLDSLHTLSPTLAADLAALLEERGIVLEERFLDGGAALPAVVDGQRIGAYTLMSQIGEGGMGTIWLARRSDGRYEGQVAVKLLNAHLVGRQGERFEREGSILARLNHPHIAHLVDAGVTPAGQPYLVLEYVEGQHINRHCESQGLSVEARLRLFLDVLDAVAHAHANLIVHRDLKPSNVLVRTDGNVKLLDFGIAKLLEGDGGAEATALTRDGGALLTPAYAAPEQMTRGTITTATDVYALGVLLYELLSGRHPAGGTARSPGELFKAIVETEPPRLSTVATQPSARTLRGDLDTIVAKALKKKPGERYASVAALAEDVRRHLRHQPISARPDTLTYRTGRFVRRHRLPLALAALALAALGAGLVGTVWEAREARRQRDRALVQLARAQGMNEFTTFLLGEAIPDAGAISVDEILRRAEALVDSRFADDPALSTDLLINIGSIHGSRWNGEEMDRIAKRAYETSLRLSDPAVRANAACLRAGSIFWEDRTQAERLVDGALAQISPDASFDDIAAQCLLTRAQIAERMGEGAATIAASQKALERLNAGVLGSSFLRVDALAMLAAGHRLQGETGRAERAYARASEELERLGGRHTNSWLTLRHNWTLARELTDPLSALAQQAGVLQGKGGDPRNDPGGAQHFVTYGNLLNVLGRHAEARAVLERARTYASLPDTETTRGRADLGVSRACREVADRACAEAALREAVETMRRWPGRELYRAEVVQEQGLLALERGDLDGARGSLSESLRFYEKGDEMIVNRLETLLALARLELRAGRAGEAEAPARKVLALAERLRDERPRSAWVGLSQLALGEVLQARGDVETARRLYTESLDQMTSTLGEEHPKVKEARARLHP